MKILSNLRLFFIIYMIVKLAIDLIFGYQITGEGLGSLKISPGMFTIYATIINIILLAAGLLLFYFLLEKRIWARIVLLIVGWLAVLDFFSSMIISSKAMNFLFYIDRSINWDRLVLIDRITDFVGLLFWGYAIFILQFNDNIKKIFLPESKKMDSQVTQT
jgi:hypothetical protein